MTDVPVKNKHRILKTPPVLMLEASEIAAWMLNEFHPFYRATNEDAKAFIARCQQDDNQQCEVILALANIAVNYLDEQLTSCQSFERRVSAPAPSRKAH